jgi:hypothetical protein
VSLLLLLLLLLLLQPSVKFSRRPTLLAATAASAAAAAAAGGDHPSGTVLHAAIFFHLPPAGCMAEETGTRFVNQSWLRQL